MEINEIKSRLSILTVLKHYSLSPDRNGMLKCPFHEDDTPSLKVYAQTNTFNCFGCGKNGDVIEFIQEKESCNKHTALVKAAELAGETKPVTHITEKPRAQTYYSEILTIIFTHFKNGLNSGTSKKVRE